MGNQTTVADARFETLASLEGLGDFWKVYDSEYEVVVAELEDGLAEDAEFGRLITDTPAEEREERRRVGRELLGRAVTDGDWESYASHLRDQGIAYARMGISFAGWFRVVGRVRPALTARIMSAYDESSDRVRAALTAMDAVFDTAMSTIGDAYLDTKQEIISSQQEAIKELSTPVLQLHDGLLLLPIVGVLDSHRARQMTDQLLHAIHARRARVVVIDVTGVPTVDSMVANHLVQAVEAARLLGAHAIVTGVSADVAQTLVRIGVDLSRLDTAGDLQTGMEQARNQLGTRLVSDGVGSSVEAR